MNIRHQEFSESYLIRGDTEKAIASLRQLRVKRLGYGTFLRLFDLVELCHKVISIHQIFKKEIDTALDKLAYTLKVSSNWYSN